MAGELEFSWHGAEGIETLEMSPLFEAWKPVSGTRVTGRNKMAVNNC